MTGIEDDEESVPTRVEEDAPSASTVAAIEASIDSDDAPNTVTSVAYEAPMSTYANGDDGPSTINAKPLRVPIDEHDDVGSTTDGGSPFAWDHPLAAADANADDIGGRESAPALPPPPAQGFGRAPSNSDDVTGVDMPFGGRAQSNVSTIFGDPAGAMSYPPNTWPTGSRLVQTPPGLLAKLRASPKRLAVVVGSTALCLGVVLAFALRGGGETAKPAPKTEPTAKPAAAIVDDGSAAGSAAVVDTGSDTGSAAIVEQPEPPRPPPPPTPRPKTVIKKPPVKRVATSPKKPPVVKTPTTKPKPTTTPTTKPKKPAWDPNSLFPTKKK